MAKPDELCLFLLRALTGAGIFVFDSCVNSKDILPDVRTIFVVDIV